jgi:hypothetical protein
VTEIVVAAVELATADTQTPRTTELRALIDLRAASVSSAFYVVNRLQRAIHFMTTLSGTSTHTDALARHPLTRTRDNRRRFLATRWNRVNRHSFAGIAMIRGRRNVRSGADTGG